MIPQAVATAAAVLVGNYLGARQTEDAAALVELALFIGFTYGVVAGSVLLFILRPVGIAVVDLCQWAVLCSDYAIISFRNLLCYMMRFDVSQTCDCCYCMSCRSLILFRSIGVLFSQIHQKYSN